ncbi:MAG: hypothetical protein AAF383_20860 [Cyanobacteria bacterium P01_A01_bin.83]
MTTLDSSALKARNILFAMFCVLIILDSLLVVVSRDLWAIGRILATIVVMYYVMQGKKWAKWVLIAIFSMVIVSLTALIIALHSKLSTFLVVGSLIFIIFCGIVGKYLISNKELNRYFLHKRKAVSASI